MRPWHKLLIASLLGLLFAQSFFSVVMRYTQSVPSIFATISYIVSADAQEKRYCNAKTDVSLNWHPPLDTNINNLDKVLNGHDENENRFIYTTSRGPPNDYNYCNMPHINPKTYPIPDNGYHLQYVEVITRHHKRTPYAHNVFPTEGDPWFCDDEKLILGGASGPHSSYMTYHQVYTTPTNPFQPDGFNGTCDFPQITGGGLVDGVLHGNDIHEVYREVMHEFFLKKYQDHAVSYRVTNNIITSQSGSMVLLGTWSLRGDQFTPMLIQPRSIDSLEPAYPCPYADNLRKSYGPGGKSKAWLEHLEQSADLKGRLDEVSGVDPNSEGWANSWDHYFDNLSSRLCHHMALPCHIKNSSNCITEEEANSVFRLGQYEYSFLYRDSPEGFNASVAAFGVWIGELAANLKAAMGDGVSSVPVTSERMMYRHHTAHDGSIAMLLSILQVNQMVWPGMGAEIAFELFDKDGCGYLRVLWGGQIMRSSHPDLGYLDMVPIYTVLAYFDGLVGERASKIPEMCQTPVS